MPGSTKGQLQMIEIVVVLIIFFMILGVGMLFYTDFLKNKTDQEVSYTQSLELAEVAKVVSSMPELHCSLRGDEQFTCIDKYRAIAFADQIRSNDENRRHYAERFVGYRVRITCIYPNECESDLNGVTLFDYTPKNGKDTVPFVLPIVINDPLTKKNYYGELKLEQVS